MIIDYAKSIDTISKDRRAITRRKVKETLIQQNLDRYDSRLLRWLSLDPVTHPQFSPYSAFDNNPIYWSDPSGADSDWINNGDGTWTAEAVDGAETLAQDAGISREEAYAILESQGMGTYVSRHDGGLKSAVDPMDVVTIPKQQEEIKRIEEEITVEESKAMPNIKGETLTEPSLFDKTKKYIGDTFGGTLVDDVIESRSEGASIAESGFYSLWREKVGSWGGAGGSPFNRGSSRPSRRSSKPSNKGANNAIKKSTKAISNNKVDKPVIIKQTNTSISNTVKSSKTVSSGDKNPWNTFLQKKQRKVQRKGVDSKSKS